MIDLTIKTPDKNYDLKCPSNWEEVTVKQFIQLENNFDGKDLLQLLSILTGLDRNVLANANSSVVDKVDSIVSYIFNPPNFNKLKRAAKINIGGKKKTKTVRYWVFWKKTKTYYDGGTWIKMPTSLEMEPFGAALDLLELRDSEGELVLKIPKIMAIYSQPTMHGKYLEARIPEVELMINDMPIVDVYPHCFFFFERLKLYKETGIST